MQLKQIAGLTLAGLMSASVLAAGNTDTDRGTTLEDPMERDMQNDSMRGDRDMNDPATGMPAAGDVPGAGGMDGTGIDTGAGGGTGTGNMGTGTGGTGAGGGAAGSGSGAAGAAGSSGAGGAGN
ncbi:hypothetical protein [Stutzerimonas nitrititolerans]|uniref:hypothetical protein n=1 Tax=Stutzerimonas nitrititolerans TaxID=2482751 RepID=UPI00289946BE|nr:hypothetical protein [Stutzerimonas nitrititolerans]